MKRFLLLCNKLFPLAYFLGVSSFFSSIIPVTHLENQVFILCIAFGLHATQLALILLAQSHKSTNTTVASPNPMVLNRSTTGQASGV